MKMKLRKASGSIDVVTMDFNPWARTKREQSSSGTAHMDLWPVLREDMGRSYGTQSLCFVITQD